MPEDNDNTQEQEQEPSAAQKLADKEAGKAKREGFVNVHGEPRVQPAPDPEAAYGGLPDPKYVEDQDDLPKADPLKGAIPGSELAAATLQPESPHLGEKYVPGSANTAPDGNVFAGVPSGPPRRKL